jgi:ribosomal protein S11
MAIIKKHFNFGPYITRRIGRIFFKKSSTNLFITLTDFDNKVIICRSAGCAIASKNKRRKISPQAVEDIMRSIKVFLKLYKINCMEIILRERITVFWHFIIKELVSYGISILNYKVKFKKAHNGMRKRKLRRL